ncbi:MAG TPA: sortase [Candidatus Saccharimonadales bacterium]|nr:sortase [Candidatus Saccharimonadales bacterium]
MTSRSQKKHNLSLNKKATADFARQKISAIFREPSAKNELSAISRKGRKLSKHQAFIADLISAGQSMPEIQTAWHNYYLGLSDVEKNEVWQEFYDARQAVINQNNAQSERAVSSSNSVVVQFEDDRRPQTSSEIKNKLLSKIDKQANKKWVQRGHSLLFGLGMGSLVVVILLFGFFNDRFLAPFITPSRSASAQALILDTSGVDIGPTPEVIIPKINVQIPVVYSDTSIDPNVIESSLEDGVVHFPTTPLPGQTGNGAIFGHSSNNILNPGMYKFAFVLLHDLVPGDTFMLTYNSKLYTYQVYKKSIVSPTDVSVLQTQDQPDTFSLITCDPPGTSLNRLVVVGKQISPDPTTNTVSAINQNTAPKPAVLPSNSPSLWSRLTHWI